MCYVLGVDGGNTKTDYLLYDLEGRLIAHLRAGTCSHEALTMDGARREMDARIGALLSGAGVSRDDIAGAAFGLAGIDQPLQQDTLTTIVRELGFSNSVAMNDGFLGIKAGSPDAVGVCSVNGTGTVACGIDEDGRWLQVGGIGSATGDEAGGAYLANRALRAAYGAAFRFFEPTLLLPRLMALLGCADENALQQAISTEYQYGHHIASSDIIQLLFGAADDGDAAAIAIVRDTADALARSAAGCAVRLRFRGAVPTVLIGSVWSKGRYAPMIEHFRGQFARYAGKACEIHILDVPPAVGSVLWALELATGHVPNAATRTRVIDEARGKV